MNAFLVCFICLGMIFLGTIIGSAFVFFIKKNFSKATSALIIGFASGIMIAASFFGLISPSIEKAKEIYPDFPIVPVLIGFLLGGALLFLLDKIVPHLHLNTNEEEGHASKLNKNIKFFLAVTLHNIPEGLAVGFACGLMFNASEANFSMLMWSALSLAIGITIQNIPEGSAVSVPLLESGFSRFKAFMFGSLSGIVEPLFGIFGILLASNIEALLPWLLAFAGGAMIYVTVDELIPSMHAYGHFHRAIWAFMIGFAIMMVLELLL